MTTIYTVYGESGQYSDARLWAVRAFTTREEAEADADRLNAASRALQEFVYEQGQRKLAEGDAYDYWFARHELEGTPPRDWPAPIRQMMEADFVCFSDCFWPERCGAKPSSLAELELRASEPWFFLSSVNDFRKEDQPPEYYVDTLDLVGPGCE